MISLRHRAAGMFAALLLTAMPLAAQAPAPLPPASPPPPVPVVAPTPPVKPVERTAPPPPAVAPAVRAAEPALVVRPQDEVPPLGATMRCKDGTWLSGTPSAERCDRNRGLAVILPVRAPAPPPPAPRTP